MYKVFYGNRSVNFKCITKQDLAVPQNSIDDNWRFSIDRLIELLETGPDDCQIEFFSNNPSYLKDKFDSLFVKKKSAGGLVQNPNGELLFILKNDFWDLPKGHIDYGETSQEAAKREVEEETGIGSLEIVSSLPKTEHFFLEKNGQWVLKETDWFFMRTNIIESPKCLGYEGILAARWIGPPELDSILDNAFASVREVVEAGGFWWPKTQ